MVFHRLNVPTYQGGLPAGYDFINDPAANGDPGAPAGADGKKSSGPNQGTYFVAFGEDGTSANTNRGIRALAENTDLLDDLLRRDLAITQRTADVSAGGAVGSIVIAGEVFVGALGTPNTQDRRARLVAVLDDKDQEIIDAAGSTVEVSLIHDGASNNVVGTVPSGFFENPTVNLSPPIPAGTTYRVYYGERSSLAELPPDALTEIKIRAAEEVDGTVQRQLRNLHAPGGLQAWDAPWDATIRALAAAGLNERYRRSTVVPGTFTFDSPGNGSKIIRDGMALTLETPVVDCQSSPLSSSWPDSLLAAYRVTSADLPGPAEFPNTAEGGDVGLFQEADVATTADTGEFNRSRVAGPLVLEVVPRDIRADTLSGELVLTRISPIATATLNPASGSSVDARRTIECAAGQFFLNASGHTAVRLGIDLIEVETIAGVPVATYVADQIVSVTQIRVRLVSGGFPDFGAVAVSARIRWLQPVVSLGGSSREARPFGAAAGCRMTVAQPAILTENPAVSVVEPSALFLAATQAPSTSAGEDARTALIWGGFDLFGGTEMRGRLYGDGGIFTLGGRQRLNLLSSITRRVSISTDATVTYDPEADGGLIVLSIQGPIFVNQTTTFVLSTSGYAPIDGDSFTVMMRIDDSALGELRIVWPANFVFSGDDGVMPLHNVTGQAIYIKWEFRYLETPDDKWFATRTDY